jgi:hypothetical protein
MADLSIKPDEIDWRVGNTFDRNGTKWGMLLGYIDSRLAMEKLDLLDPQWSSRMEPVTLGAESGVRCTLTVNGVSREDVGTASNTEPLKGAFSDALKRAAVHFGIGRELYDLPHIAVECNVGANGKVKSPKALPSWNGTRWTIDGNLGWVKYDHEPEQPASSATQSTVTPRKRMLAAAQNHSRSYEDLERFARQVGVPKGRPATDEQIEQIIALIETPGSSVPTDSPATDAPASEGTQTSDIPTDGGLDADVVAPEGVPPSSSGAPTLEDGLAVSGGELVPDKPDYVKRAEARAAAAKPKNARAPHEATEVTAGL